MAEYAVAVGNDTTIASSQNIAYSARRREYLNKWPAFVLIFGLFWLRIPSEPILDLIGSLVVYLLITWSNAKTEVFASANTLTINGSTVRTDRLVRLHLYYSIGKLNYEMKDRDGNQLAIDGRELTGDLRIYYLVQAAVVKSAASGLKVEKRAARAFSLPQP